MKYILDTHTHTYASGHAYNTMNEMAMSAKEKGLELLCITDHGPAMPGAAKKLYFINLKACYRSKYGISLKIGAEVNIVNFEGKLDISNDILKTLDLRIASLHPPCLKAGSIEENTNAYCKAMKNPNIDIIGHPDDGRYPVYYEQLVKMAKEEHVILEVNNSSLLPSSFRSGAKENYQTLLKLCKEYKVPISIASDAHVEEEVGNFKMADELLTQMNFPSELIANISVKQFEQFLALRGSHESS